MPDDAPSRPPASPAPRSGLLLMIAIKSRPLRGAGEAGGREGASSGIAHYAMCVRARNREALASRSMKLLLSFLVLVSLALPLHASPADDEFQKMAGDYI